MRVGWGMGVGVGMVQVVIRVMVQDVMPGDDSGSNANNGE